MLDVSDALSRLTQVNDPPGDLRFCLRQPGPIARDADELQLPAGADVHDELFLRRGVESHGVH